MKEHIINIDERYELASYEYGWILRDKKSNTGRTNKYFSNLEQACHHLAEGRMVKLGAGTTVELKEAVKTLAMFRASVAEIISGEKALHSQGMQPESVS